MSNLNNLTPDEFEQYVYELYKSMGYRVKRRGKLTQGDQGVDIEARKWWQYLVIQCKRYQGNVPFRAVRDLLGVVTKERATKGVLVTTGGFTAQSIQWAKKQRLELIDAQGIDKLLKKHRLGPYKKKWSVPMSKLNPISWIRGRIPKDIMVNEHPKNEIKRSHPNTGRLQEHKETYRIQLSRRNPNANADITVQNDLLNKKSTVQLTISGSGNKFSQIDKLVAFYQLVQRQGKQMAKFKVVE